MNNSEFKTCPNCGAENAPAAKFCTSCGANLENVDVQLRIRNGGTLAVANSGSGAGSFVITTGPAPAGYHQKMTVMAESLESDGTTKVAWYSAMESLRNVLGAGKLNGIANMQILSTHLLVNGRQVPAFMIYGDGIVAED